MDTNKLIHLKTVFQTQNIREAANLLNISHAGLSKSIKSLELELGVDLITKDGRGIKITQAGLDLISETEQVIFAIEKLKARAAKADLKEKINCRIGSFEVFSTYLAPFIKDIFPAEIKVSFKELLPGKIEEHLLQGRIDYGISYHPVPFPELDHLKVSSIEMGVFGNKKFEKLALRDLPFVAPIAEVRGTPTKAKGLDGWPDNIFPRNIEYKVSLMETALALSRKGHAVGYFPKFIIRQHNEVVSKAYHLSEMQIPKKIRKHQDIYLIKRKEKGEDMKVKKLAKLLRSLK